MTEPTRFDNTLDLYFTDRPSQITDVSILPGMCDHDIVMITADIHNLQEKFSSTTKPTGMLLVCLCK